MSNVWCMRHRDYNGKGLPETACPICYAVLMNAAKQHAIESAKRAKSKKKATPK